MQIKHLIKNNKGRIDPLYIHLLNPMKEIVWEGWLDDVPKQYLECKIKFGGAALMDAWAGINGHFIELIH